MVNESVIYAAGERAASMRRVCFDRPTHAKPSRICLALAVGMNLHVMLQCFAFVSDVLCLHS